jgi:hypothetical protein
MAPANRPYVVLLKEHAAFRQYHNRPLCDTCPPAPL